MKRGSHRGQPQVSGWRAEQRTTSMPKFLSHCSKASLSVSLNEPAPLDAPAPLGTPAPLGAPAPWSSTTAMAPPLPRIAASSDEAPLPEAEGPTMTAELLAVRALWRTPPPPPLMSPLQAAPRAAEDVAAAADGAGAGSCSGASELGNDCRVPPCCLPLTLCGVCALLTAPCWDLMVAPCCSEDEDVLDLATTAAVLPAAAASGTPLLAPSCSA